MAKNFNELRAGMSAQAKAASAAEHRRLIEEMSLLQLRKARELTQTKIAGELHMGQGDVSKLERRTDMYVSTLAHYLQAVGADLEIRAVFPDGRAVKITQFSEESSESPRSRHPPWVAHSLAELHYALQQWVGRTKRQINPDR